MKYLRRIRYWLGARLLRPHVKREWEHYRLMTTEANPSEDGRWNCEFISMGLIYSIQKDHRRASAEGRDFYAS